MGLLSDDEGNPRWRAGGIVLVGVLALFLLPPLLRNKEISHPRSGQQQIDLCPLLPEPPSPLVVAKRQRVAGGSSLCEFKNKANETDLTVGIVTTREASSGGRAVRTGPMYDTWLKEVAASGATDIREQRGDWAKGSSYRNGRANNVLIEDRGVMLTLTSNRLDADALMDYARTVSSDLRKP